MNLNLKQKHLPGETLVNSLIKKVVFACQGECVTEKKTVSTASTSGGSGKKVGVFLTTLFFAGIFFVFGANTAHANFVTDAIEGLLNAVFAVVGFLVGIATIIFAWVLKPENFAAMMNMSSVQSVWIMVRDFLNMAFILVLLFAAFCTVFQVEKWNLKKVWLGVLLNALLVNFSFPIARFFIDISNIVMYYFLNNMFAGTGVGGDGVFAGILAGSELAKTFEPPSPGGIKFLLMAIIFTFIFGMTLLVLASMFVVRMIALTILVMFSPVGFVGYIFPSTHKYADMWWENLMKYCFSGPVMVFVIMVALSLIREIQTNQVSKFVTETAKNSKPDEVTWLASAAFMVIPIVILWFGIGIAQSFGVAGASTFTGAVKNGANWLRRNPMLGAGGYAWRKSGAAAGVKKGWEGARKSGKLFGSEKFGFLKDNQADRDTLAAGIITKGWGKRNEAMEAKKMKDFSEKVKENKDNHETKNLHTLLDEMDRIQISDEKSAMDYAERYAHLTDPAGNKKNQFESAVMLKLTTDPVHTTATTGFSSEAKDAYYKNELSKLWAKLQERNKVAQYRNAGKVDTTTNTVPSEADAPIRSGVSNASNMI